MPVLGDALAEIASVDAVDALVEIAAPSTNGITRRSGAVARGTLVCLWGAQSNGVSLLMKIANIAAVAPPLKTAIVFTCRCCRRLDLMFCAPYKYSTPGVRAAPHQRTPKGRHFTGHARDLRP